MSRAVLLFLLLALVGVVVFVDFPGGYRWSDAIQNWAHAPAFGLIAIGLLHLSPKFEPSLRRYVVAAGAALFIGVAVEVVQHFIGRDADVMDVAQDALGIAAALPLHALWMETRLGLTRRTAVLLGVTATLAVIWATAPLTLCAAAYWHRARLFPVIVNFQSPLDLYFLRNFDPPLTRMHLAAQFSPQGNETTAFAPYGEHPWPGVVFEEPPANWTSYKTLVVDVANPNVADMPMILTVHDRAYNGKPEDRFDRTFTLPARQRLVLRTPLSELMHAPKERAMDLSEIWRMAVAQDKGSHQPGFFLNRVWLE